MVRCKDYDWLSFRGSTKRKSKNDSKDKFLLPKNLLLTKKPRFKRRGFMDCGVVPQTPFFCAVLESRETTANDIL